MYHFLVWFFALFCTGSIIDTWVMMIAKHPRAMKDAKFRALEGLVVCFIWTLIITRT
jgi:hypothetical protein